VLPNSQRINRGGLVLTELVDTCRNHGFTDVVILHEHRGEPGERVTHPAHRRSCCSVQTYSPHAADTRCGWATRVLLQSLQQHLHLN
jgi:hypothetical protein